VLQPLCISYHLATSVTSVDFVREMTTFQIE
jgi:hypothetical protein